MALATERTQHVGRSRPALAGEVHREEQRRDEGECKAGEGTVFAPLGKIE